MVTVPLSVCAYEEELSITQKTTRTVPGTQSALSGCSLGSRLLLYIKFEILLMEEISPLKFWKTRHKAFSQSDLLSILHVSCEDLNIIIFCVGGELFFKCG